VSDLPFFHEASETVRFWVLVGDEMIGAMVGKHTLHYRFNPGGLQEDSPMSTFQLHRSELEAAVRRRVGGGSMQPVLLREADLPREPREVGQGFA